MTYSKNPWQSYRTVATQTASKGQLVLMLFDGAIRFLDKAIRAFQEQDPLRFNLEINNNIIKAQAIINELNDSLNMADGGELSKQLRGLYDYFDWRLQEANLKNQDFLIRDVVARLTVLRNAWSEMLLGQGQAAGFEARGELLLQG